MNKNACRMAQHDGRSPFEMAKECIFPFGLSHKSYPSGAADGEKASSEVSHYERKHEFWGLVCHREILLSSFNFLTIRPSAGIGLLKRAVRGYTQWWMFVGNKSTATNTSTLDLPCVSQSRRTCTEPWELSAGYGLRLLLVVWNFWTGSDKYVVRAFDSFREECRFTKTIATITPITIRS